MAVDVQGLLAARQPQPATFMPAASAPVTIPVAAATAADAGRAANPSINDNVQNIFTSLGVPGAIADTKARYAAGDTAGAIGSGIRAAAGGVLGAGLAPFVPVIRDIQGVGSQLGGVLHGILGNRDVAAAAAGAAPVASQAPTAAPAPATPSTAATATSPAGTPPAKPAAASSTAAAAPAGQPSQIATDISHMSRNSLNAMLGAFAPYSTTAPQRQVSDINTAQLAHDVSTIDPNASAEKRGALTMQYLTTLRDRQEALIGNTLANQNIYGRQGLPETPQ